MADLSRGFTLTRTLDATPEAIWAAWTEADQAAHWWHPRGVSTPRETVEMDPRVGGRYRYTMVDDANGDRYPTGGEYREVVPLERLVFTWGGTDGDPEDAALVTLTIQPLGDLTRLTFDLRGVDGTKGDEDYYDGWDGALDALAEHLGQTAVHG